MGNLDASRVPTFVKWAGGKTQLLKQIKPFFPEKIDRYFEPFVGGGAVFFYVKKRYDPEEAILSDSTEELVNCYKIVRDNVDELIELLMDHKKNHSKDSNKYYYQIRATNPSDLTNIERAGRFLYLNKTCYNGLYRVNSKGIFNVPLGRYKNPSILMEDNLREANNLLQGVTIKHQDFSHVLEDARRGDFVYFDPPYYPMTSTAYFTSYTPHNFLEEEQTRLADVYKKLGKKGCLTMESNSDTKLITELYKEFKGVRIEIVKAKRMINSDATKRGEINEVLILNY